MAKPMVECFTAITNTNSEIVEDIDQLTEILTSAVRLLSFAKWEHTFALLQIS
jgi:hypothetical protein